MVDSLHIRFNTRAPKYVDLFFANADSGYAEVCVTWSLLTSLLTRSVTPDTRTNNIQSIRDHPESMAAIIPFDGRVPCRLQGAERPITNQVCSALNVFTRYSDVQDRQAQYLDHVEAILQKLPQWRAERLPPPRVNQSQVIVHHSALFLLIADALRSTTKLD
jgi:hypothetical protein